MKSFNVFRTKATSLIGGGLTNRIIDYTHAVDYRVNGTDKS